MLACFTGSVPEPAAHSTAATHVRSRQHLEHELAAAAQRHQLVVVQLAADWCEQSRAADDLLRDMAANLRLHSRVRFLRIDVDDAGDFDLELGLLVLPTLALFKGGRLCQRLTGLDGCCSLRQALQCRGVLAAPLSTSLPTPDGSASSQRDAADASSDDCSSTSSRSSSWSDVSLASCSSPPARSHCGCWAPASPPPVSSRRCGLGAA